jgi:transcriptional regulator with XRE-family HTH domain
VTSETGPQTIHRVLSSYQLGRKLRTLRLRKKIALADLAKHTGLSPSMLSQLENGKMIPTLPTLARIAMVFDVGLEHFFGDQRGQKLFSVVRSQERMRFPERAGMPEPTYFFECLTFATQGKGLQAYVAEFPHRALAESDEHFHDGSEFLFVLDGALTIRFQGEDHELRAGDSVLLDSSEPHSYRGAGKKNARAIVVTAPPRV